MARLEQTRAERITARIERIDFCIERTSDKEKIAALTSERVMREAELVVASFRGK